MLYICVLAFKRCRDRFSDDWRWDRGSANRRCFAAAAIRTTDQTPQFHCSCWCSCCCCWSIHWCYCCCCLLMQNYEDRCRQSMPSVCWDCRSTDRPCFAAAGAAAISVYWPNSSVPLLVLMILLLLLMLLIWNFAAVVVAAIDLELWWMSDWSANQSSTLLISSLLSPMQKE